MTPPLSAANRRVLAVAILIAIIAVFFLGVVRPLVESYDAAHSTEIRLIDAIARARRDGDPATLRAELSRLMHQKDSGKGLLTAQNEYLAEATLQKRLKASVEAANGELRSVQVLPTRDERPFRRITIRAQIVGDIGGLQQVFYDLEAATPLLFLDKVDIRVLAGQTRRANGGENPRLDATFDLYGYMRKRT